MNIDGLKVVPPGHQRELRRANKVTSRTVTLLHAGASVGAEIIMENPADRGDENIPHLYEEPRHGPIWLVPEVKALQRKHHLLSCTFPMCQFGGDFQKYYSPIFARIRKLARPSRQNEMFSPSKRS